MREASPKALAPSTLVVLVLALVLAAMLLSTAQATIISLERVKVDMETSEDVLVMNSDVDLTFTVIDLETGDPMTGCQVEVHIDRDTGDGVDGDGHTHGEPVEVPDTVPAPGVVVKALQDPKAGWNLHVLTDNFRFAPERASTANVWGEGHAHLYVDGAKVGRLYTEWFHVSGLQVGEHTLRVTLNTNDHMDMTVGGVVVEGSVTVTETREPSGHSHGMMPLYQVPDGVANPDVQVTVHQDPKKGWNVHMGTTDFRWAPENASTAPVMGEGHAHLYVDGHKVARVYGEWYHLGSLAEGEHQVRVTLNANNHSDYAKDGVVIEDVVNVTATGVDDGHGSTSITLTAAEGREPGKYRVTHHFEEAGDYTVEVHVAGEGYEEVSRSFSLEVLEGDPAPVTIAGVVLYVALAIGAIMAVQYVHTRRGVRQLQEASERSDGDGTGDR